MRQGANFVERDAEASTTQVPACVAPQARVPCFKRALPLLKPEGGILLLGASYHAAATPPHRLFRCVHPAAVSCAPWLGTAGMAGHIASRLYPDAP